MRPNQADELDVVSYVARMTGQVVGVAMSGAIIQTVLARELPARISGPNADEVSPIPFIIIFRID